MSGIDYTTQGMIDSIKTKGILPESQNLYLPADIVSLTTDELISVIVPLLMSVKEEYLTASYDQAIGAGERSFFIHERALGLKLRDLVLVDTGGQEIPLDRYEPEDLKHGLQANPATAGFYLDNDRVNLIPIASDFSSYTLRQKIFRRPNNLILTSQAGQVTAINTATKEVTISTVPSAFTTSLTYDMIKGTPSFRAHAEGQAITSIVGFVLTFSATLPEDLAVGDWIAPTGFSPIAQIPYEAHKLLEQRVVIKILEGLKDKTGMDMAQEGYKAMVEKFTQLVTPRVDGAPQKLVSRRGLRAYSRASPRMW